MKILLLVLFVVLPVGLVVYGTFDLLGDVAHLIRHLRSGRRGRHGMPRSPATVTAIRQTNSSLNGNPEVIVHLRVRPVSGAAFPAVIRTVVPQVMVPRLQAGCTVAVAYDPDCYGALALVLDDVVPYTAA